MTPQETTLRETPVPAAVTTVVVDGAFGAAVADEIALLRTIFRVRVGRYGVDHSAVVPGSDIILATARADARIELGLNAAAVNFGTRFVPVVLAANLLRVGPVVRRGTTGCALCLRTRTRQHANSVELMDALETWAAADPEREVAGFLPMHASLAAGLAVDALDSITGQDRTEIADVEPAVARFVDLLGAVFRQVTVTGVHGCPVCGLHRNEGTRTIDRIAPAVRDLVAVDADIAGSKLVSAGAR